MNIFSSLAKNILPRASAATDYDYGFPEFGFSLGEMDSDLYQDPFENAKFIEPLLAKLNTRYKKCFSTTIDPGTFKLTTGKSARYDEIKDPANNCSNQGEAFADGTTELTRYRFYLADMITGKSLACYEGLDEDSCKELGFGYKFGSAPQQTSGVIGGTLATGTQQELAQQVLNSPNVRYEGDARDEIQLVANGDSLAGQTCGNGLSPILLGYITALAQNHQISISSLVRPDGCPDSGHNNGCAVDIDFFDGVGLKGDDPKSIELIQNALAIFPATQPLGFGVGNKGPAIDSLPVAGRPIDFFTDHPNHVHTDLRCHRG